MDGDPAVEPQLDSFSLVFPLPYRVGFLVTLGQLPFHVCSFAFPLPLPFLRRLPRSCFASYAIAAWGWGLNLHYFYLCQIDVPSLIRYPGRPSSRHVPHHVSTYRLAVALSTLLAASIMMFWMLTWRVPSRVIAYDWLPMAYLAIIIALPFLPLRNLPGAGRRHLLTTLRRVSLGGIAEANNGKFGDILLADVLTSYAKVCGDLFVSVCMFFIPGDSSTGRPDRNCGGAVVMPLLMALPSLIRFRQCMTEYLRVRRGPYKESTGWGGQHLANALKYSTAFPVLITSSLQRQAQAEAARAALTRAWLAATLVNSLYSFYWDVAKDWDLTLFSTLRKRNSPYHAWGLRDRLIFRPTGLYYVVICLDLALRCAWSMKLSPHLYNFSDFESGIFVIELLEVLRRWIWIFFRVETEWIRRSPSSIAIDDILLEDYRDEDG